MRARAAWGLGAVALLLFAGGMGFYLAAGVGPTNRVIPLAIIVVFSVVGTLVVSSQPRNPIGWIFCGTACVYGLATLADGYARYWLEGEGGSRSLGEAAAWFESLSWIPVVLVPLTFLLLLFPDGRLLTPRWQPVAWSAATGIVCLFLAMGFAPGHLDDFPGVENPYAVDSDLVIAFVLGLSIVLLAVALVGSPISLYARFRRAAPEERQQIKWLVWAGALAVAAFVVGIPAYDVWDGALSNTLILAGVLSLAVTTGVAIRRYRLYEIDVVINRTLVYGALTATLAFVYLGTVLMWQLVLSPSSDLAVAASTLAVAGLFRPVRSRIQAFVDRRFYRGRYDAQRTLADFTARLRDEVEMEAVQLELRAVVSETVQPAHLSLWIPERPA
jgi:hypothetical protein